MTGPLHDLKQCPVGYLIEITSRSSAAVFSKTDIKCVKLATGTQNKVNVSNLELHNNVQCSICF